MMGTKIRARYQRRKGRDLYDLYKALTLSNMNIDQVIACYKKYMSFVVGGNSGIYKHVSDFSKFCEKGYFEDHLKKEIIEIIKSQIVLGISVPYELPVEANVLKPELIRQWIPLRIKFLPGLTLLK